MFTARNDENPLFIEDVLYHISRHLNITDLAHLKMANKRLNEIFNPKILREQLKCFSIKQIIKLLENKNDFLFLDNLGKVWRGDFNLQENKFPIEALELPSIKTMVKANTGAIFLSEQGQVWVYGLNFVGDLGSNTLGLFSHVLKPSPLASLPVITQIASKHNRSFFLDEKGTVWRCGDNDITMGDDEKTKTIDNPMPIKNLPAIRQIVPSFYEIYFLDYEGQVWRCGRFADSYKNEHPHVPTKLCQLSNIKNIYPSQCYSEKMFFINKIGEVFILDKCALEIQNYKKIPNLIDIQYVVSSFNMTFYVDSKEKVYFTGELLENKNGIESVNTYTQPVRIEKFDSIKNIIVPNSYAQEFIACINQAGEVTFSLAQGHTLYNKLLELKQCPSFNFINNGYLDHNLAMFVRQGGNISIHEFSKNTINNILARFNFATQYHLDVLERHGIEMKDLVVYACQPHKENKTFYDACINVLRSEGNAIRLIYLMQLQASPWFDMNEAAETMLVYPIDSILTRYFDFKAIESSFAALLDTVRGFYEYFHKKFDKHQSVDCQNRLNNFSNLINKLINNEINTSKELSDYFSESAETFTKMSITMFSFHLTFERRSQEYADLQKQLVKVIGGNEELFCLMKKSLLFMNHVIQSYSGSHPTIKNMQSLFLDKKLSNGMAPVLK